MDPERDHAEISGTRAPSPIKHVVLGRLLRSTGTRDDRQCVVNRYLVVPAIPRHLARRGVLGEDQSVLQCGSIYEIDMCGEESGQ
jgi:hypothetical protein